MVWSFAVGCQQTSPGGGDASSTSEGSVDGHGETTTTENPQREPLSSSSGTTETTDDASTQTPIDPTMADSSSSTGADPDTVLVHVDFEADPVGAYTETMVEADFGSAPGWNNGLDEGRATIVEARGNRFLRITYPAGLYGPGDGGVQFEVALPSSHAELRLSYRVRFADGFAFVKGGKLPGLVGGSSPTGCVEDTDGFSARMMWRTGGAVVQYMYFPEKVEACGDDYAYTLEDEPVQFGPGTWHRVEHRLVMNTPGVHDGMLQAWFDGQLALDEQAFLFRLADATYGIDALYVSTFFGGSDESWAPGTAQVIDFDDFVITAP